MAVAPSDGDRVYALIEAEKGGLFRSDDGGDSWDLATPNRALRQRAWYYSTLTVHPSNPNEVWFPQVPMLRTIDGGKTIEYMTSDADSELANLRRRNGRDKPWKISYFAVGNETWGCGGGTA